MVGPVSTAGPFMQPAEAEPHNMELRLPTCKYIIHTV
jgi:hypothetical protein